jgi:hypothetical protein
VAFVKRVQARLVVIIADNDEAGLKGALALQQALPLSVVWTPPCKDLREFVAAGGTRQMVENAVRDLEPQHGTMQERTTP